jgi:hypothetical protein
MTEELHIEYEMILDSTTFPLHNFLKFGSYSDLKTRIGAVMYANQDTSTSRRLVAKNEGRRL